MADAVDSQAAVGWIHRCAERIAEEKAYLTRLDSDIGDADHGINMDRGFKAALEKLDGGSSDDVGGVFKTVGMALVSKVGGASGPLYGSMFLEMGKAAAGKQQIDVSDWAVALAAGVEGVVKRGKAEVGDKTMIDALVPARDALEAAASEGVGWDEALARCADAAREGMESTIPLVARKGRASYLGERSAGHQDPGATSSHMLLEAASAVWGSGKEA